MLTKVTFLIDVLICYSFKERLSKNIFKIFIHIPLIPSIRALNVEHFSQNDKITQKRRDFNNSCVYFNEHCVSYSGDIESFSQFL